MKILLGHNFYRSKGGEDRCVELLSDLLTMKGHAVLPFFKYSRAFETANWTQRLAFPFEMVYSRSNRSAIQSMIKADPPQLAYLHNLYPFISPSVLRALKDHGIPIILTVHAFKPLCINGLFFTQGRVCEKCGDGNYFHGVMNNCRNSYVESAVYAIAFAIHRRLKLIEPYVDIFVSPSEFLKTKLIQYGFPENKVRVIPHFVSIEKNESVKRSPADYVVYFGRLSHEKGVITLLKAAKMSPHIEVVIIGDGPLRARVSSHIREQKLNNVCLAGYLSGDDLWSRISGARFTIVPSESYESFGYSAIESLYWGKPVVASRIGGLPEIIEDGVDGLLFNPGDPHDLAEKINDLWAKPDRIKELGIHGERKAKTQYTPERFYERLSQAFERLGLKEG
ncbi:MAG TPA: glycosyltransferase family 4 protein [Nitrospiria bacterium]|nr:glycosyltransferase family 4 protein [Nitrospiria bacterium]